MRIVAVADTHTSQDDLGAIPEGDVFVHAGDIVPAGELEELQGPARWIRELPHRHKIVVAGNHDWYFFRSRKAACSLLGDGVHYLQDSGCTIAGVQFWGVQTDFKCRWRRSFRWPAARISWKQPDGFCRSCT